MCNAIDKDGKKIKANGWYDPSDGSIHLDVNAGAGGEGTILFTAAHELTHFIRDWSPEKFGVLADFLMEQYNKTGQPVRELIENQIAKAKKNGRTISFDEAYEEVIADSMETMLTDGKVISELASRDRTLFEKIRDFIADLAKKVRALYKTMLPNSNEGRIVADMVGALDRVQAMFTDALADASDNYANGQKNNAREGVRYSIRKDIVDENGRKYERVVELDYRTFNKVRRKGSLYIDFIRDHLINQKIEVYNIDGSREIVEFARENERTTKDGNAHSRKVIGELTQARNELKKLVILNAVETAEISTFNSETDHRSEHSHQWLDENGWDYRTSYVMTKDGVIYPVTLFIAKTRDGRNILYDVNVKIKEGVATEKIATSLNPKEKTEQAPRITTTSDDIVSQPDDSVKRKFSDRDEEADFSSRTLLANALESVARTPVEKERLAQYKSELGEIEKRQKRLREVEAELRELQFAKGARNAEYHQRVNEATDQQKLDYLINEFKANGYSGRPIVAFGAEGEGSVALTGSHRIYAAREAGIEIPVVYVKYDHTNPLM